MKSRADFRIRTDRPYQYLRGECKTCQVEVGRQHRLKHQFGITETDYEEKLKKQNGLCAICGQPNKNGRRLAIDHDHQTDAVRDLLCGTCNPGLGSFFDDPNLLRKAIEYLIKWGKELD